MTNRSGATAYSLERRNHWEKTSHALLVGAILHVLYAEADKTLAGVAGFLSDPKRPIETTLRAMMTTPHRNHEMAEPGRETMLGIVLHRLHFGRGAERVRYALGRLVIALALNQGFCVLDMG